MDQGFVVRKARHGDEAGTGRVHVDTWRHAYDGLIAKDFLERLSYERSQRNWERALEKSAVYYVATVGEQIVGFAIGGPTQVDHGSGDRDRAGGAVAVEGTEVTERSGSAGGGEIFAIYVLPEYQGYGIGCTLFRALVRELQNRGFRPLELRVLKANQQARSFYERQGWRLLSEGTIPFGDREYDVVVYRMQEN